MISILVVIVVVGVLLWFADQLPIDPTVLRILRAVVIVALCLWLLSHFVPMPRGWGWR